jgi:hypothetical protein
MTATTPYITKLGVGFSSAWHFSKAVHEKKKAALQLAKNNPYFALPSRVAHLPF